MSQTAQHQIEDSEPDFSSVREVLETGERVGMGNRKSVYHSDSVPGMEDQVVKVFSSESPEQVRDRTKNAGEEYFPESHVGVVDLSDLENAEDYGENALVVVQEQSDDSIVNTDMLYSEAVDESVEFADNLVRDGHIIDDFKLEALHVYGDDLKFVDFEDSRSTQNFPFEPGVVESPSEVNYRMACMYASLAKGLSDTYGENLQNVMDDIVDASEEIDTEVYNNKESFSGEMIDYSSLT